MIRNVHNKRQPFYNWTLSCSFSSERLVRLFSFECSGYMELLNCWRVGQHRCVPLFTRRRRQRGFSYTRLASRLLHTHPTRKKKEASIIACCGGFFFLAGPSSSILVTECSTDRVLAWPCCWAVVFLLSFHSPSRNGQRTHVCAERRNDKTCCAKLLGTVPQLVVYCFMAWALYNVLYSLLLSSYFSWLIITSFFFFQYMNLKPYVYSSAPDRADCIHRTSSLSSPSGPIFFFFFFFFP